MTSKIKVDNIENQCGGAVVTKCGGTTTISGTVVKSNTLQASDAGNIISQSGTTITLGASGDTINLASGASQTGFGRTGTVDWDTTPKTATFSAVSGNGYFCNTSGGAFTVNLPAGSAGAIVSVADYAATWQTNNVTVTPNGTDKIGSLNTSVSLDTEGQSVTFVFVDATQGWINTMDSTSNVRGQSFICASVSGACNTLVTAPDCANVKIATFTGPGTFTVCGVSNNALNNVVSYMVIAGGGGGARQRGGGGGAGGFREYKSPVTPYTASPLDGSPGGAGSGTAITVTATGFPITVGGGGVGGTVPAANTSGSNSVFSTITSTGGGFGANPAGPSPANAAPGGSGGGGVGAGGNPSTAGGSGNTPSVTPSQGNDGGAGSAGPYSAGAGGGAGGVGGAGNSPNSNSNPGGGNGGLGITTSINATPTTRAGGGGGGTYTPQGPGGLAGPGGGGAAGQSGSDATAGTANTGGGGGGGAFVNTTPTEPKDQGKGGGSGIVIIRYKFQ